MPRLSTRDFFNEYALEFDNLYSNKSIFHNLFNRVFRRSFYSRFKRTMEECSQITGKTVLDIGCGTGVYSLAFAKRGAKSVQGVDFSDKMIELARSKAKNLGVSDICRFEIVDFENCEFPEKSDYVIAAGYMDYVQQPKNSVDKIIQLTKHKAVISFPTRHGFLAWQRRIRYAYKCPLYMYDERQIRELFSKLNADTYSIENLGRDYLVILRAGS